MKVTLARVGKPVDAFAARYRMSCDALPGRNFGPYGHAEMIRELMVFADLAPADARNAVLDAFVTGTSFMEVS